MASKSLKNIHRLITEAVKVLPPNESFLADLNFTIEKINQAESRVPSQSYKPSSMNCIRNMYFQLIGTTPDEDRASADFVGICESGTDRHLRIQNAIATMKQYGVECEYIDVADFIKMRNLDYLEVRGRNGVETRLYHKGLNISFLCDGIIKYKSQYYILEIKTETMNKWRDRDGVAEDHYNQGITYSICLGINQIMYLYENRDNCAKRAYIMEITEDMKFEIISKIESCDQYVRNLIVPPIPPDIAKKTCSYCKYKKACRSAG